MTCESLPTWHVGGDRRGLPDEAPGKAAIEAGIDPDRVKFTRTVHVRRRVTGGLALNNRTAAPGPATTVRPRSSSWTSSPTPPQRKTRNDRTVTAVPDRDMLMVQVASIRLAIVQSSLCNL